MRSLPKPLQILLYEDVLCGWCYVAHERLPPLLEEFGELVKWKTRSYPLRIPDLAPSAREIEWLVKDIHRVKREPEAKLIQHELWSGGDAPRSSVPALLALEAARLQGQQAKALLFRAMQRTALEMGVNVTRSDVIFELACRVGLGMNRFAVAFHSAETKRLVLEQHRLARSRGVTGAPTLVIGQRWMISGLRERSEYREHIVRCLELSRHSGVGTPESTMH